MGTEFFIAIGVFPVELLASQVSMVCTTNRPRSIYQYSNMAPRLSGQTSIFGVVFIVTKSFLGIEGQRKLFDPKASEPCSNIDKSNVAWPRKIYLYTLDNIGLSV